MAFGCAWQGFSWHPKVQWNDSENANQAFKTLTLPGPPANSAEWLLGTSWQGFNAYWAYCNCCFRGCHWCEIVCWLESWQSCIPRMLCSTKGSGWDAIFISYWHTFADKNWQQSFAQETRLVMLMSVLAACVEVLFSLFWANLHRETVCRAHPVARIKPLAHCPSSAPGVNGATTSVFWRFALYPETCLPETMCIQTMSPGCCHKCHHAQQL